MATATPSQKALEQLFTKSFPAKIKKLQNASSHLHEHWNKEALQETAKLLQRIAVPARALQLMQVVSHCHQASLLLEQLIQEDQPYQEESLILVQAQIDRIGHSIEFSKLPAHFSKEALSKLKYHTRILLCFKDLMLAEEVGGQLQYFGYQTTILKQFSELLETVHAEKNFMVFAAILLDMDFVPKLEQKPLDSIGQYLPYVFLSKTDTVERRLMAVRAGARAFFTIPFDFTNILEVVDDLVIPVGEASPYRVLIIEDSKTQANIIQDILLKAKMAVQVLKNPFDVDDVLQEFRPELILMDLYMPQCTGIELAAVIRQQETHVGIPIVFLSSELNVNKQMDAMRLGGDDFLTKPIEKEHLISAVSSRIERSRILNAEMTQDSLTGLINHTRILEQLDSEIARSQREKTSLSFVMFDIDHFKAINDQYGHPTGDRVIKGLSRLFKQRFRKSDSIGRYGGEEFAIILPHSDLEPIVSLLNAIREAFAQLVFQSDDGREFQVTISGGLASLCPEFNKVDTLVQAADRALYTAKHHGRNQISIAQPTDVQRNKHSK